LVGSLFISLQCICDVLGQDTTPCPQCLGWIMFLSLLLNAMSASSVFLLVIRGGGGSIEAVRNFRGEWAKRQLSASGVLGQGIVLGLLYGFHLGTMTSKSGCMVPS
jgi:hypothetical protein